MHTQKLWEMINAVTREHITSNPRCKGDLSFDAAREEQWGVVSRQRAVCSKCDYRSRMFKLYEEVATQGRGRKSATANMGLNIAMTQTPVAATSVIKMLLGANISAPAMSSMHACATKVVNMIHQENIEDRKTTTATEKN